MPQGISTLRLISSFAIDVPDVFRFTMASLCSHHAPILVTNNAGVAPVTMKESIRKRPRRKRTTGCTAPIGARGAGREAKFGLSSGSSLARVVPMQYSNFPPAEVG